MPAGRHIAVPGKADALPDIRQQEILQAHDSYAVFIPLRKAIQRNHIFGIVIGNLQQIVRLAGGVFGDGHACLNIDPFAAFFSNEVDLPKNCSEINSFSS